MSGTATASTPLHSTTNTPSLVSAAPSSAVRADGAMFGWRRDARKLTRICLDTGNGTEVSDYSWCSTYSRQGEEGEPLPFKLEAGNSG